MGSEFSIGSDSNVSSRLSRQQPKEEVKAIAPSQEGIKENFSLVIDTSTGSAILKISKSKGAKLPWTTSSKPTN